MDVPNGGLRVNDAFTIHFQNVLKHTVRGRVRGAQIQSRRLFFD